MKRILFFALLAFLQIASGQSLKQLEKRLGRMEAQRRLLVSQIDSLDALIRQSRPITDSLRAVDSSGARLKRQLAGVFSQSLKKLALQKRLKGLDREHLAVQNNLYRRISVQMDSLQSALRRAKTDAGRKRLKRTLYELGLRLTEVSPELRTLSYRPQKIKAIDLAAARDSLERAIMRNYLQGAQREVEERLNVLDKKKNELEEMAALQNKTEDFLDDIDEGPIIAPQEQAKSYPEAAGTGDYAVTDGRYGSAARQQTFTYWLTQLQRQISDVAEQNAAPDSTDGYRRLLNKINLTEQALRSLQAIIRQKLGRQ